MKRIIVAAAIVFAAQAQAQQSVLDSQINAVNSVSAPEQAYDQGQRQAQYEEYMRNKAKAEAREDRRQARQEQMEDMDVESRRADVQFKKGIVRREDDILNSQMRANEAAARQRTAVIIR